MNAAQRKQLKRTTKSRDNWKDKAKDRNVELRKAHGRIKELLESRDRWKSEYQTTQQQLEAIEQGIEEQSRLPQLSVDSAMTRLLMIQLSIYLVIHCSVSFRSVPKILSAFQEIFPLLGCPIEWKIPHFTTVIRWNLRFGYSSLKQTLSTGSQQWICVIDHTVQVGCKKALVILRVPIEKLQGYGALKLQDVEVLYLQVQEKCNGRIICDILEPFFIQVGYPLQIVMDGGPDLNKGIKELIAKLKSPLKVTYDVTHLIAKLLKKKYGKHPIFLDLLSKMAQTKNKILQTPLAYLTPLKERSKSRFLNLPTIAKWSAQMIEYLTSLSTDREKPLEKKNKILQHLSWLFEFETFLKGFWDEVKILSEIQKCLKNVELCEMTYHRVSRLMNQIDDPMIREPLVGYLQEEFQFAQSVDHLTLLTSDIIESLFGKYKYIAKVHCMSEINRMIFILPAICQPITVEQVKNAFDYTSNKELQEEIQKQIPSTLLSTRRKELVKTPLKNKNLAPIITFPIKTKTIHSSPPKSCGQKTVGTTLAIG